MFLPRRFPPAISHFPFQSWDQVDDELDMIERMSMRSRIYYSSAGRGKVKEGRRLLRLC